MCGLWPLRTSGQNTLFKIQYYLTTLQNKHNYGGRKYLQDTQSSCKVDDNQFWIYLWKQALTYLQHKCSELDLEIRPELDNETSIRLFSPSKVLKLKLSLCVRSDWVWWGVILETLLWWYNDDDDSEDCDDSSWSLHNAPLSTRHSSVRNYPDTTSHPFLPPELNS